jgi:hypothetical protein
MTITQRPKSPVPVEYEPKGLSPKARTTIAIAALALCLIVGAGIVWWLLIGSTPKRRTVSVDPAKQGAMIMPGPNFRMAPPRPRDTRGVNRNGENDWFVRGEVGAVRITKNAAGAYDLLFVTPRNLDLSREQIALLSGRFRILKDPLMAKEWGVTDDQVSKLDRIDVSAGALKPAAADLASVRQLWDAYMKATDGPSKMDAQKKLVEKVDQVGKANVEVARSLYGQRTEQIKQILTAEQVKRITQP